MKKVYLVYMNDVNDVFEAILGEAFLSKKKAESYIKHWEKHQTAYKYWIKEMIVNDLDYDY